MKKFVILLLISLILIRQDVKSNVQIDSTNLPILIINTNNQQIPDEPKIMADMRIIYNGPGQVNKPTDTPTEYNGKIGIEVRGQYSSSFPQTPYGIETRNADGSNLNVSLFGMPEENDWVFITNYNEKSLTRSVLPFDLFRKTGNYAPRALLVEVIINNEYEGIYVFCEKIKRDKGRVDIAKLKLTDNAGDSLTGGYIFSVDYIEEGWYSDFLPMFHEDEDDSVFFNYVYPKPDDITPPQEQYIQGFVRQAETALHGENYKDPNFGYRKYFDVPSFIDYFLINELSRSVDGFKKSRFFYKDRDDNDPRMVAGPVWDFDWGFKNMTTGRTIYADTTGGGWSYLTNVYKPTTLSPDWYAIMLQDPSFADQLITRYFELRSTILDTAVLSAYIDSVYQTVNSMGAKERHFTKWPITSRNRAGEVEPVSESYEEEIGRLKNWIKTRLAWMDANIADVGSSMLEHTSIEQKETISHPRFHLYPNPGIDMIHVQSGTALQSVALYNILGQRVYQTHPTQNHLTIPVHHLPTGMYILRVMDKLQKVNVRKISIIR